MKKAEFDAILLEVHANDELLKSCPRHQFDIPIDRRTKEPIPAPMIFCKWKCSACGGIVDGSDRRWYQLGQKHGLG